MEPEKIVLELGEILKERMDTIQAWSTQHREHRDEMIAEMSKGDRAMIPFSEFYDKTGLLYARGFMDVLGVFTQYVQGIGQKLITEHASKELMNNFVGSLGVVTDTFDRTQDGPGEGWSQNKATDPRNEMLNNLQNLAPTLQSMPEYGPPGESTETEKELS